MRGVAERALLLLAFSALLVWRFDRVRASLASGSFGDSLALATLFGGLAFGAYGLARAFFVGGGPPTAPRRGPFRLGVLVVSVLALAALLAPYLAPHAPDAQHGLVDHRLRGPSLRFPLGTDALSRDLLSRLLHGARITLPVGALAAALAVTAGSAVGAVAGFFGGRLDAIGMRLVDLLLSIPRLALLLALVAFFPGARSPVFTAVVIGLTGWMGTSRIVRAEAQRLRALDFVAAGRALGFSDARLLVRHVLPNCVGPISVSATLGVGGAILLEASLSFLGLGAPPPTPTWGGMVEEGRAHLLDAPWIAGFAGLSILLAVSAFHALGEGLRERLDPKRRVP